MDRKEFVKNFGLSCLGATAVVVLLQSCATTNNFAQNNLSDNILSVSKAEFIRIKNGKTIQRRYILVKTDKYNFPICIFKISVDSYSALLLECTHKGCELKPHGDYLSCPCHGSEFSNRGIVQNPPAEENLKTFQIRTDNENLYISL